ncbi:uncharacterized protein LOC134533339 isoform X3 [Bacillus rossius redtenbacheri]|uniref:uncharacterized protein LOC134533339 isoform X3 n=1 Tax=Bacillus rossius redtenbacheri TaxID=93214 RepID=UPI002FDC7CA5
MMPKRVSKKKCKDWCTVKFLEDGIVQRCKETELRKRNGTLFARWLKDGRWYPASLLESGDDKSSSLKNVTKPTGNATTTFDIHERQIPLQDSASNANTLDVAGITEDYVESQSCSIDFYPIVTEHEVLKNNETLSEITDESSSLENVTKPTGNATTTSDIHERQIPLQDSASNANTLDVAGITEDYVESQSCSIDFYPIVTEHEVLKNNETLREITGATGGGVGGPVWPATTRGARVPGQKIQNCRTTNNADI